MTRFHLKLLVGLLAFFALVFLGMWMYEPLRVWYYAGAYRSETDARERIRLVDILCQSERGKKALYKAFRKRCISEMVRIPAGSFMMGSENVFDNEKPVHKVTLSGFRMDKYEVTNEKYYVFVKLTGYEEPYHWENGRIPEDRELHPVSFVSWNDAKAYADWLKMELPTEAQWEYACRAGSTTDYCYGDNPARLGEYAWYQKNSGRETHPVGEKKPNKWGLYDMHGNVWEWCQDWFGEDYYGNCPKLNPRGPVSGEYRVLRGGGWYYDASACRSANRNRSNPDIRSGNFGFRLCCSSGP